MKINRTALFVFLALLLFCGCAGPTPRADGFPRPFSFRQDTLAYSNELFWVYREDPVTGKMTHVRRTPAPAYVFHCFVVAKTARLFFQHARFDAQLPKVSESEYRELVLKIIGSSPRVERSLAERIVIPGYANLREFSQAHETLLKSESGTPWASYFQRGNWRMIFWFTENHQQRIADQLMESLWRNRPPVVHLSDFPTVHVNHAVLLFDAQRDSDGIEFSVYDPNNPSTPGRLRFDRATRRFYFPKCSYFPGGRVNVYEIYDSWNY